MTDLGRVPTGSGTLRTGRHGVLTLPNVISGLRLLLVPVFAVLLAQGSDAWALVVLAVAGASDWLDGVQRLHAVLRHDRIVAQ